MSTALIITMGSISVSCAIIEKVLIKLNKGDEAQMVSITGTTMLGGTVVGSVLKVFGELRKLG